MTPWPWGRRLGVLAVCAVGAIPGCGDDGPPPNLVLITLDTTRADRIGCYGYEAAYTPVLDSLAAEGVRFDRAMASVPVTLPSHSTILTGVGPTTHGVRDNGIFTLSDDFETVAETLVGAGYQTGGFVSAFVLSRPYGIAQGFTTYDDHFYNERPGHLTTRKAVAWLDRVDPDAPFFLWVHYYDPHLPRTPVEPFRSMPGLDPYDQEMAAMDAAIGQLLGALRAKGVLDHTDVVVVGDHGEGLGDHSEPEHGMFLYDTTMRVPFLLVRHDAPPDERGVVRETLVSTSDVQPTLLDLAGLDGPEGEGGSVVGFASREGGERWAYGETYFTQFNFYHSHLFSYTSARWKYVDGPIPELYDLAADPHEQNDLIASLPDTAQAIKARLDDHRDRTGGDTNPNPLTPEEIERLQSLGYLGGGDAALSMETGEEFFLPDPKELKAFAEEFAMGLHLINEGEAERAAELLETVIEHNPENLIARLNLGRVYTGLQEAEKAIEHLQEAVHLAPTNATTKKYLGIALQSAGRNEEAIDVLRGIRTHPSQGISASKEIARCQLLMGQAEEAQHTLRFLADSGGGGPEIARLAEKVGALIDARARAEAMPDSEPARLAHAGAALDVQLLKEAEAALDFTGSTPRLEASRHRLLGSVAGAMGDYDRARTEFELALPAFPDDAYIQMQLTALYLDADEPARTLELCDSLIRGGQPHPVVYYNKACALARLGDEDGALEALRRAIRRGYSDYQNLQEDTDLDALRDDVRFTEVLELIGQPS